MDKPNKEEITNKTPREIAKEYDISEKTAIRWLKFYGLFNPTKNFGCKLNMDIANTIRQKHKEGAKVKDLAIQYKVTNSSINRIINNANYSIPTDTSHVSVIYNIK